MTAITKAFTDIADAAVDPDSPLDSVLMTALRDRDIHLREWLGASFTAGAIQDHNHDGVNSALIRVGPNAVRNGSFEESEIGWTLTDYTGGSHAIDTSNEMHGAKSLAITSTVTANGGGDALMNEFIPVAPARDVMLGFWRKASGANVSSKVLVEWYDSAQAELSETSVEASSNTPTAATEYNSRVTAPANAAFFKLRLIGGDPGVGSSAGTIYYDGVYATCDQHELTPKVRLKCGVTGNILDSYNVTSITDTGTGQVSVTIATDFPNTSYVIAHGVQLSGGGGGLRLMNLNSQAAGSFSAESRTFNAGTPAFDLADPTSWHFLCFGV